MEQHQVTLMGREFRIRTDSGREHIEAVARYVNEKIGDLNQGCQDNVSQGVLLLAALNMADEVFAARERNVSMREKIRTQSRSLLERLGHPG
jgi:cell division protein ZapA